MIELNGFTTHIMTTVHPTTSIRRASLVDIAYETILEAIIDQQLPPGSRVNMDALATQLQMSNTPIRESLARLTTTGLVQQISNRGFIVAPIPSEAEYHHLFDVRCLLETHALQAATFDDATLDRLDAMARQIASAEYGTTYRRFIGNLKVDESFHLRLVKASGNGFMASAWQSLNFYSHVSRLHTHEEAFNKDEYRQSLGDHNTIVQLLCEGRQADAVECLRNHIRSAETRLIKSARILTRTEGDA
ncbi:MAG: GntR family transcriptional regulator [Chloroflexota bacterium]